MKEYEIGENSGRGKMLKAFVNSGIMSELKNQQTRDQEESSVIQTESENSKQGKSVVSSAVSGIESASGVAVAIPI